MTNGLDLQRAEAPIAERDALIEELRDMVHQDLEFLRRSRVEGFDTRSSMRIALTSATDDAGKPIIAAEGATEDLPDVVFPRMAHGFSVHFQAVPREEEALGHVSPTPMLREGAEAYGEPVAPSGGE